MSDIAKQYQQKLVTAEAAIETMAAKETLMIPYGVSQPPALIQALAKRAKSGSFEEIIVYYMRALANMGELLLQYDMTDVFKFRPLSMGYYDRQLVKIADQHEKKVVDFVPNHFSQIPKLIAENFNIDTFIVAVSPLDDDGYFNLGHNVAYSLAAVKKAKKVIVEVNRHIAPARGNCRIPFEAVDIIVEHDAPLAEYQNREPDEIDHQIGQQLLDLIPNRATIQIGVGSVPNAITAQLQSHQDLGIHTELLTANLTQLIEKGVVTGKYKKIHTGEHLCTLSFGEKKLYDFLASNKQVVSYPVDYVNNPHVIAQHDDFISINSLIEIDLYGQINVENINHRQYNAIGGHFDFLRGAYASNGGKSILAFRSTAMDGKVSRIVPYLHSMMSGSRADIQYVATEHGVINLKGLSSSQRAQSLIKLAAPQFRDELQKAAKQLHL